jgi:hypothetical protein
MTEPQFDLRWRFTEQIALPGHSVGAGIVYSPAWAPGLSVSVSPCRSALFRRSCAALSAALACVGPR